MNDNVNEVLESLDELMGDLPECVNAPECSLPDDK